MLKTIAQLKKFISDRVEVHDVEVNKINTGGDNIEYVKKLGKLKA